MYVTSSFPNIIELSSNLTNKGIALIELCNYLHISTKDCVVSGDGENDYPMLEVAGYSITPKNGHDSLKKIATEICDNIEDDGVINAYKKLFNLYF